jgi:hypothetical protein
MRNNDPVEINGVFMGGTGNAILLEDADGKEHWLPRSQIEFDPDDPDKFDPITVTMPEWLAEKEGLV